MTVDLRPRALPAWVDPADLFAARFTAEEYAFWLDAGPDASTGWSWIGTGSPASAAPMDQDLTAPMQPTSTGGPLRGGWIGWLDYDSAAERAGAPRWPDGRAPEANGIRADSFVAFDHSSRKMWAWASDSGLDSFASSILRCQAAASALPTTPPTVEVIARHTSTEYRRLIDAARAAIREGDAYQLCLTTRFSVETCVDPLQAYLRLRRATPTHHGGYIRIGDHALASASPEQFLEVRSGVVRTRPIKGTRPRSSDVRADAALAADLSGSVKERAENVMIVDLMRNDLQRVCDPGSVAAERLLEVESYAAVHQLVSTVAGRLRPGSTLLQLLDAAFPAGSMTGAPKLSAMRILYALEAAPRGVFAGCFGWVGDDGAADLAMVIRSIVFHPGGAYVGAGGGITWRSDADEEVAEVALKARGPLAALGGGLPTGW